LGKLFVVATPIGNLSDISERALETLRNADLIAAEDTRRTLPLLNHFSIKTPLVAYHKFNEHEKSGELIEKIITENINVALVSDAGTPCISDPGCILISEARDKGIDVVAVPGPSAAISALSVSGFIFTQFCFMGFIPREKREKENYYNILLTSPVDTFVIYEAASRIIESLEEIASALPECRAFVINDITKFYEKSYRGDIGEVLKQLEAAPNARLGEYAVVIQRDKVPAQDTAAIGQEISPEALLVDEIIKSGCSLKEAIANVSEKNKNLSKNEVYKASLNLKKLF
jgi:16S rRNA (cytidine1402-2'-O)-methyltransferase